MSRQEYKTPKFIRILVEIVEIGIIALKKFALEFGGVFVKFLKAAMGFVFTMVGGIGSIAALVIGIIALSFYLGGDLNFIPVPVQRITGAIGTDLSLLIGAPVLALIPSLFILFVGCFYLFKLRLFNKRLVMGMAFTWIAAAITVLVSAAFTAPNFSHGAKTTTSSLIPFSLEQELLISLNEKDNSYDNLRIYITESTSDEIEIKKVVESRGSSDEDANANASMVDHKISLKGNELKIDDYLSFKDDALFRAQEMTLYIGIPTEIQFKMDRNAFLESRNEYSHQRYYYKGKTDWEHAKDQILNINGKLLECKNCPEVEKDTRHRYKKSASEIEIEGNIKVVFDDDAERLYLSGAGEQLLVQFDDYKIILSLKDTFRTEPLHVELGTESLRKLTLRNGARFDARSLETEGLELSLSINSKAYIEDLDIGRLNAKLDSSSYLELAGRAVNTSIDAALSENANTKELNSRRLKVNGVER